jgi:hypothetical protein
MEAVASDLPDLARDHGLRVDVLRPHPGGFESDRLVADGSWFVKIWRSDEQPARLEVLSALHAAGLPVAAPVPARTGDLPAWWHGRTYAVFPFVQGREAADDDWRVTAMTATWPPSWTGSKRYSVHGSTTCGPRRKGVMAARIRTGTDRPGVDTWGFRRIARLDSDLEMSHPFCG